MDKSHHNDAGPTAIQTTFLAVGIY